MVEQPPPSLDPAVAHYYERAAEESRLEYFTTAYFHRPEELANEVNYAGFESVALFGVEGPGWMLPDFDERWNDPGRREILMQAARALESGPAVIGCSAHLIVAGRKPQT